MKKSQKFGMILVTALWIGLTAAAWLKPAGESSLAERRPLAQLPEFRAETVLDGSFMEEFGSYATDQFPLRDRFRQLKAVVTYYVFGQKDNNDIYIADGSAVKMEYPLKESSVDNALERFDGLYEKYLSGSNVTFAIVPDKGFYLAEGSGHLSMDYDELYARMEEGLPWARFVDLRDCLSADSYYRTDTHWRQEAILPVAEKLGLDAGLPFTQETLDRDFYGVYYGQAALPLEPDTLRYLTWEGWEDCTVYSYDTGKETKLYDMDKLGSNDLYDVFLSGGMALQTITNPNAPEGTELIVFRDSFGSSLVPLLARNYETVTLIDTRYLFPDAIGAYVDFEGKDVLMLYSTLVLNSSEVLRK